MNDLISRDELLKAIDTWDKFGVDDTNSLFRLDNLSLPHYVPYIHYDDAVKCIKGMPSAQQESCEYYALCRHGRDEKKLRVHLGFCEYCNVDSDGYATPIEKNCHAFVRFGANGWELSLKANGWHGSAKIRYCPMCGRDLLVK